MFKQLLAQSNRFLNLQEYHSKNLLKKYGCTIQRFYTAKDPIEARAGAQKLLDTGAPELVVKAQILAGGRGKGTFYPSGFKGGVKLTKDVDQVESLADKMLNQRLVTKQTSKDGVLVETLMVAHALNIEKELYLAILMDRDSNGPVIVASPAGGMDIEKVAEETPELIYKLPIDIFAGISESQALNFVKNSNLTEDSKFHPKIASEIVKLYNLFIQVDATQVEINPLGITDLNEVVCFDAKINFDDCAKYRQAEIFSLDDQAESDPRELQAEEAGLNFIPLDGNIACIVNGAGLAMATMDMIKFHGGEPANFLDLGGGVNKKGVLKAFEIILQDRNVETILVNIFGGIVNCEIIASGLVEAYNNFEVDVPVVVRLEGTNVESAKEILKKSGLPVALAEGFEQGAIKAIEAVGTEEDKKVAAAF